MSHSRRGGRTCHQPETVATISVRHIRGCDRHKKTQLPKVYLDTSWNLPTSGTTWDIVFQHNTAVSAASTPCWNSIYFSSNGQAPPFAVPITSNVWILDNALCDHPTGDWGYTGTTGLENYMGNPSTLPNDFNARFYGNVIWAQPGEAVPNYPVSDLAQAAPFTYVNPSAMDYQLLTPVWTNTTDGKQAGIDNNNLPNH